MRATSLLVNSVVISLLSVLLGTACKDPTEPARLSSVGHVEREWHFFVIPHNGATTQAFGDPHHLESGTVNDLVRFGPIVLHPPGFPDVSGADVFSNETASTYWVAAQAPHGTAGNGHLEGAGVTLNQVYHYVVDGANPSLTFTLSNLDLAAIDGGLNVPTPSECHRNPSDNYLDHCDPPFQSVGEFGIWAHHGDQLDLLSRQTTATLKGYEGLWKFTATTEDGDRPAFATQDFLVNPDADESGTLAFGRADLTHPVAIAIPMGSLTVGDTLIVETRIMAWAEDRRQVEDFSGAYLRDPVTPDGVTIEAEGVHLVSFASGAPIPLHVQVPAPACGGTVSGAGTLQFDSTAFTTSEAGLMSGQVTVTRTGGTTGLVSATVTTHDGTATGGSDFTPTTTVVRFGDGESGSRTVRIPLIGDQAIEADETINLTLSAPGGCATIGGPAAAVLTILDDDNQAPPPPPTQFSIGGTVSGLTGSGLVLHERFSGFETRPTGDGPLIMVPARPDGSTYEIQVGTQPANPLQNCTVTNATGTITGANVTDVAVVCTTPTQTSGLDSTFGTGGRVFSTMTGGATALAIQPDGRIVIAGDSKVQRFNTNGTPDAGFGGNGEVPFVFPGATSNQPQGIAIQSDNRIVVTGFVDDSTGEHCAVMRYNTDGTPDATFGTGGRVALDFKGAESRCLTVATPFGSGIIVAGQAAFPIVTGFDGDIAVARLTSTGIPDSTFDSTGVATIDIGGTAEWANAVKIQNDGKIVLAGRTAADGGSDPTVAVVRFTGDGRPDSSFSFDGVDTANATLGSGEREAFDLVIQSDGRIVIAGQVRVGANFEFLLARFAATGGLDPSFGTNGVTTTPLTSQSDVGRGIALMARDNLVVAGRTSLFGSGDFGIVQYSKDGHFDSFGLLTIDFLSGSDGAEAVGVQSDGKIVAAGFARNGAATGAGVVRVVP